MCNSSCLQFIQDNISASDVKGGRVLEVGARNVNGSAREAVMSLAPLDYIGVDLDAGPGVDEVCDVTDLAPHFGPGKFSVVISTEMLEHVRDWRAAVSNMKTVLAPGGLLLLTTRSAGYPYHGYPHDFWRYEEADIRGIFSDMTVLTTGKDPLVPGIFVKARKPETYSMNDLSGIALYSVISGRRCLDITDGELMFFKIKRGARTLISALVPAPLKRLLKKLFRQ